MEPQDIRIVPPQQAAKNEALRKQYAPSMVTPEPTLSVEDKAICDAATRRGNLENPKSCWNKARSEEMTFIILGRDPAAAATLQAWIDERLRLHLNKEDDEQIKQVRVLIQRLNYG